MSLTEAAITLDAPSLARDASLDVLRLGFMPLTDCAPLIVAEALGLFRKHQVSVALQPLSAWVALRDRIAIGKLDGGQMLCPMPIASHLGLGGVASPTIVGAVLSSQGNTITLSDALMAEIETRMAATMTLGQALASIVRARQEAGRAKLRLAMVYPFSSHNYLLRLWLAEAGIDPELDVTLRAVPPPQIADELAEGRIDGFCAGQPWGSRAVDLRCGRIALDTAAIWPNHPEKLLAFSRASLDRAPEQIEAVLAAVIEAGEFLADHANHAQAAIWLHERALPHVPQGVVRASLASRIALAPDEAPAPFGSPNFDPALSCPDPAHGAWWLAQMQRWGHAPEGCASVIDEIWRPDIWRRAAARAGIDPGLQTSLIVPGEHA